MASSVNHYHWYMCITTTQKPAGQLRFWQYQHSTSPSPTFGLIPLSSSMLQPQVLSDLAPMEISTTFPRYLPHCCCVRWIAMSGVLTFLLWSCSPNNLGLWRRLTAHLNTIQTPFLELISDLPGFQHLPQKGALF